MSILAENLPIRATERLTVDHATELEHGLTSVWQSNRQRPYGSLADWTMERLSRQATESQCQSRLDAGSPSHSEQHASRTRETTSLNEKFHLWAHQWRMEVAQQHVSTCRMVLIQGQQNEILNTWIFPVRPSHRPVFAAELISMGGAPRLTFVDIQTPGLTENPQTVQANTLRLRSQFKHLITDETPPEWAVCDSQGEFVFSRTMGAEAFGDIQSCYRAYFENYLQNYAMPVHAKDLACTSHIDDSASLLYSYQQHHQENSPGTVFLGKLFGDEWTRSFLQTFLFTRA